MTFWKRRNVVPCFIIYYRKILLCNVLRNLYLFELLGIIIKNNNWFALCYEDKSISQRHCDTVVKLGGNAVVIICFLLK